MKRDFDKFGGSYYEQLSKLIRNYGGEEAPYYNRLKADLLLSLVTLFLGSPSRLGFLDLGCGIGLSEMHLMPKFASGAAIDLSRGMLKERMEKERCLFLQADATNLPFENHSFDIAFSFTLIHHIPLERRSHIIREMNRVVKPGGLVINFDHNPLKPLTRHIVGRCEYDRGTVLNRLGKTEKIYREEGIEVIKKGYFIFFPKSLSFLRGFERHLAWLPLGGQYYVVGLVS